MSDQMSSSSSRSSSLSISPETPPRTASQHRAIYGQAYTSEQGHILNILAQYSVAIGEHAARYNHTVDIVREDDSGILVPAYLGTSFQRRAMIWHVRDKKHVAGGPWCDDDETAFDALLEQLKTGELKPQGWDTVSWEKARELGPKETSN